MESHKPRRHWPLSGDLNTRDVEVMQSQLSGDTIEQTCEKVGISRPTVHRTKKKKAYRDVAIAAAEQNEYTAETYAKNMIDLTKADKTIISASAGVLDVPDNITRFNANSELGDVFGVKAPKQFDLKHSMAAMSDEELMDEIEHSAKELDGRLQHNITGAPDAAANVTHQVAVQEPAVACESGKPPVGPAGD